LGDDVADEAHGKLPADHGQLLEQIFLLGREAIDARG
jgi:hypothetical protein